MFHVTTRAFIVKAVAVRLGDPDRFSEEGGRHGEDAERIGLKHGSGSIKHNLRPLWYLLVRTKKRSKISLKVRRVYIRCHPLSSIPKFNSAPEAKKVTASISDKSSCTLVASSMRLKVIHHHPRAESPHEIVRFCNQCLPCKCFPAARYCEEKIITEEHMRHTLVF